MLKKSFIRKCEKRHINYKDYMSSAKWMKKRIEQLNKFPNCFCCGLRNWKLTVHHRTYKNFGHDRMKDLITLCRECHDEVHYLVEIGKTTLNKAHKLYKKIREKLSTG